MIKPAFGERKEGAFLLGGHLPHEDREVLLLQEAEDLAVRLLPGVIVNISLTVPDFYLLSRL